MDLHVYAERPSYLEGAAHTVRLFYPGLWMVITSPRTLALFGSNST
jgi:hypothetical protein